MTRHKTRLSPQGAWEVKRRITLPGMVHPLDTRTITERLKKMSGVRGASPDLKHHRVTLVYDITQTDYLDILQVLEEIGFPAVDTWWTRLKAKTYQYVDTNGRDNAKAPSAPCCSNPKGISQLRR